MACGIQVKTFYDSLLVPFHPFHYHVLEAACGQDTPGHFYHLPNGLGSFHLVYGGAPRITSHTYNRSQYGDKNSIAVLKPYISGLDAFNKKLI